jgi:hypothetical protein
LTGLLFAFTGTAGATTELTQALCANFGCDGHNPNIQNWQSTYTVYSISDGSGYIDLRSGVTDGDQYAWARVEWTPGGYPGNVWVDRYSKLSGTLETGLGKHSLSQSGAWSAQEAPNTWLTWSGMYYNPSTFEVRACVGFSAPGGTTCTDWY